MHSSTFCECVCQMGVGVEREGEGGMERGEERREERRGEERGGKRRGGESTFV